MDFSIDVHKSGILGFLSQGGTGFRVQGLGSRVQGLGSWK